ncbi:hypothetical protein CI610_03596 [invertebrate metagenome]|uniref:Uncharacterized protein n=1 Tax=invertebrate metagenome TaxID=1711999 RepID=A0A2H9T2Q9_9ZZZZ
MSKQNKIKKAGSKLGNLGNPEAAGNSNGNDSGSKQAGKQQNHKPDGIVQASRSASPTSVRLTPDDKANLRQIVQSVNDVSRSKVSSTKVIQALLHMGTQMRAEKVLRAVRELL